MSNQHQPPEEPPLLKMRLTAVAIIILMLFIALWFSKAEGIPKEEVSLDRCFLEAHNEPIIHLEFFQENYLISKAPPFLIEGEVLATLTDKDEVSIDDIIPCESNGDPLACNKEYGCRGGMGLCGIISRTWNTTLDKMKEAGSWMPGRCWHKVYLPISWNKTEPIFDGVCNRLVGEWLLENEGSQHWGTATTWWGSYYCWKK